MSVRAIIPTRDLRAVTRSPERLLWHEMTPDEQRAWQRAYNAGELPYQRESRRRYVRAARREALRDRLETVGTAIIGVIAVVVALLLVVAVVAAWVTSPPGGDSSSYDGPVCPAGPASAMYPQDC